MAALRPATLPVRRSVTLGLLAGMTPSAGGAAAVGETHADIARLEEVLRAVSSLLEQTDRLAASMRSQVDALRDAARNARTREEEQQAAETSGRLMLDLERVEQRQAEMRNLLRESEGRMRELRGRP